MMAPNGVVIRGSRREAGFANVAQPPPGILVETAPQQRPHRAMATVPRSSKAPDTNSAPC